MTASEAFEKYPPPLSEEQLSILTRIVRDWQLTNGSLLKVPRPAGEGSAHEDLETALPIGVSLFPSVLPKQCFEEARDLQHIYNALYAAIACDHEWLRDILKE